MPQAADRLAEDRAWRLLTRDVRWQFDAARRVSVRADPATLTDRTKFQLFEVLVPSILAALRPDYQWEVSPNRSGDGGSDFWGLHRFLEDETLGISATITIGGQCKIRSGRVRNVVDLIAGSVTDMLATADPTVVVIALSAPVTRSRIDAARARIEKAVGRQCHILDRRQIEGLMAEHRQVVSEVLGHGTTSDELADVLAYVDGRGARQQVHVEVSAPRRVLAGVPFRVTVDSVTTPLTSGGLRLRWVSQDGLVGPLLVSPPAAEVDAGTALTGHVDDPMRAACALEFVSHAIGDVDLGEIVLQSSDRTEVTRASIGTTRVVDNVRPRFYPAPFEGPIRILRDAALRAGAGVEAVTIVGSGGSGKSRLIEEVMLELVRDGWKPFVAAQSKFPDDADSILAELLVRLTLEPGVPVTPNAVVDAVARFDAALASRTAPAIDALVERSNGHSCVVDQELISTLVLLTLAQGRACPLVVHLQDLHLCSAEVLDLLSRYAWQVESVAGNREDWSGVLFLLEGRTGEDLSGLLDRDSAAPFEAFLARHGGATVTCAPFSAEHSIQFVHRLFETQRSAYRAIPEQLLEVQSEVVDEVVRTAGSNPFHTLAQVQLLKESGVLGQNRQTGLLHLVRPEPLSAELPASVFESIRLRWEYLRRRAPDLALLLWGVALVDDRVPIEHLHHLWRELAPDASTTDIDSTDMLWVGDTGAREAKFRHENYVRSIRRFEVSRSDRARVVDAHDKWFAAQRRIGPTDRLRWARVLLEHPSADAVRARKLVAQARDTARRRGDDSLWRRATALWLDLRWREADTVPPVPSAFLRSCDEELALVRELLTTDLNAARQRLQELRQRLFTGGEASRPSQAIERRQLEAEALRGQLLFNSGQPVAAADLLQTALERLGARWRVVTPSDAWQALRAELLHALASARALSGDLDGALQVSWAAYTLVKDWTSALAHDIVGTHANILLASDPAESERILRDRLAQPPSESPSGTDLSEVHLAMALVLQASQVDATSERRESLLAEARGRLETVARVSGHLGRHPDAAAASLMLGIVGALDRGADSVSWFAQAVASASRGRQLETLWRARVNLAMALFERDRTVTPQVRDQAAGALELMEETLASEVDGDHSSRLNLMSVPMVNAIRLLMLADDDAGMQALTRHPALRACFEDLETVVLRSDRGGYVSHEWLRVGEADYVIY